MSGKHIIRAVSYSALSVTIQFASALVFALAGVPAKTADLVLPAVALVVMLPVMRKRCCKRMFEMDASKVLPVVLDFKPMIKSYVLVGGLLILFRVLAGTMSLTSFLVALAAGVIHHSFVGVYEETVFRGLVLDDALKGTSCTKRAVLLSAVLFALVHIPSFVMGGTSVVVFLPRMLALSMFGVMLALERLRFDNVLGGIFVHSFTNIAITLAGAGSTASATDAGGFGMILVCLVEIASLARPTYRLWCWAFKSQPRRIGSGSQALNPVSISNDATVANK